MRSIKNITLVLLAAWLTMGGLNAQTEGKTNKYGADSMKCIENLSTMTEFIKIDLYDYAYDAWKYMFKYCPAASKNTYIYGVRIMKHKIDKEKDEDVRSAWIDTLMMIYDQRVEYYNEKGKNLGRKGIDMVRYQKNNIEKAYQILSESIELEGNKSREAVVVTQVQLASVLYQNGRLESSAVIDDYLQAMKILDARDEKYGKSRTGKAIETVEQIFASSGAADCDALVEIFGPKFDDNSGDAEFLKKVLKLLEQAKCEGTELYTKSSETLFEIEPSASSAYYLAKLFLRQDELDKAMQYYEKAVEMEEDAEKLARDYYEMAVLANKLGNKVQSRNYARKAIQNNGNWGKPYILIGNLYAASVNSCGENDFEKNAVYWAVVDKYIQAKNADPEMAEEANEMIARYSRYFPNQEKAFFYDVTEGSTYTVGCWINETTRARF
jgi:tetratricopeptide (TPR) repeat protein